jgi:1,4-alpha-glucan branching enzyme
MESLMIKVSKTVRDGSVRVTFALPTSEPAGPVSVVGNFNNWDPFAHPLRKRSNGTRSTVVTAEPGSTLYFRYLGKDGHWFDDEAAHAVDGQGAAISV